MPLAPASVRSFRAGLLAAATLLAPSAPVARAAVPPEAAPFVEKHVAWLGGWKALDDLRDLTLEGTLRAAGLTGTIAVRSRRDGRGRTDVDLEVMKSTEILAAPFPKDKSGLSFLWADDALTVWFVAPGGPAAAAGWKAGERLAALDGEPASADWWKTYLRWSDARPGTVVRLTLADGSERRLTVKEYF